jgi:hypothetical protein
MLEKCLIGAIQVLYAYIAKWYKIYETLSYLKSHNFIKPCPIFKMFGVLVSELLDLSTNHKIKET